MAGGIFVGDATLRVSNTRFYGNQAGYVGGRAVRDRDLDEPGLDAATDVMVSNCTFVDNVAARDPSVSFSAPPRAAGSTPRIRRRARIYNSRFTTNRATVGGGAQHVPRRSSRCIAACSKATRRAASAARISAASNDVNDSSTNNGTINRRTSQLTVRDTLIRGRFGAVGDGGADRRRRLRGRRRVSASTV